MPDKITFRGVRIMNFDVRQSSKGETTFVRIHMRADFSDPVKEAMEWEPRPQGWNGGDLTGELTGVEMMLKPSQKELDRYAFKMPIRLVKDFRLNVTGKDDDEEEELSFTVETDAKRAYVTLGTWVDNIGKATGQLVISYSNDDQTTLGIHATDEQRQASLEIPAEKSK